jgi:hypothetical protein
MFANLMKRIACGKLGLQSRIVSDVDKNVQMSLLSKVAVNVIVLGMVVTPLS